MKFLPEKRALDKKTCQMTRNKLGCNLILACWKFVALDACGTFSSDFTPTLKNNSVCKYSLQKILLVTKIYIFLADIVGVVDVGVVVDAILLIVTVVI